VSISYFDFNITAGKSYRVIISGSTKAPSNTTGFSIYYYGMAGVGTITSTLFSLGNSTNASNGVVYSSGQNSSGGTMFETAFNSGIDVLTPFTYIATINATASASLGAFYRSELSASTTLQAGTILTVEEF
jgi:hypothetical protein